MLTVEQVKQFEVGDWLWIERLDSPYIKEYRRVWEEINDKNYVVLQGVEFTGLYPFANYGITWIAYKNKEEAEKDRK